MRDGGKNIRFKSFSSGSCGNCYFLGLEEDGRITAGVVIDAGVSYRRLKKELALENLDPDVFQAVLVTHDHMDHIRSLWSYCKFFHKPVYATAALHLALARHHDPNNLIAPCAKVLSEDSWTQIVPGRIAVRQFIVPHDATQTVGYAIVIGGYSFVIMTDIGSMTAEALSYASNAQTVVIESNYDEKMLMEGPYPYDLKMRISQGSGHLSNRKCAEAIRSFWHDGLRNIFLCHLSEHNNTPELAFGETVKVLEELGVKGFPLRPLPRQTPSQLFYL